jgi:ribulose-phosphate 3-epimerase
VRVKIAPSILSADFGRLADEVKAIATADYVHVDVMDGHFVPNLTIGPVVIEAVKRATALPLDVHLMIEDAERWVAAYAKAGADLIGVHAEACPHLHRTLQQIRDLGKRPSVVLNPATPLEEIRRLRRMIDERGLAVDIEIDGGVKIDNVAAACAAGANVIVSGSGVFGTKDYAATIAELRARGDAAAR